MASKGGSMSIMEQFGYEDAEVDRRAVARPATNATPEGRERTPPTNAELAAALRVLERTALDKGHTLLAFVLCSDAMTFEEMTPDPRDERGRQARAAWLADRQASMARFAAGAREDERQARERAELGERAMKVLDGVVVGVGGKGEQR